MGVSTAVFAGQSGPHTWDGKNETLTLKRDTVITFSYVAAEKGTLYIYSDNQGSSDNVPLTIEGGWYHDGEYDADSPLQDAGPYENGLGVYGWIKVWDGDEVRFTISTPKEADGTQTRFTLKSAFFNESVGGDSWEKPIELTMNKEFKIPVYSNRSQDMLGDIEVNNTTFCKFRAPSDGVASILTSEYLIYVLEEENIGSVENLFRSVAQDAKTNDHEFIVRANINYIVLVPNARPTSLKLTMTQNGLGQSAKFPIEITEFPTTIDLKNGNNYYAFSHELIGDKNILEVAVSTGWRGTITYMEDPTEVSAELVVDNVVGKATTFTKNIDPYYLNGGNSIIVNFEMTNKGSLESAVTLSLREPKEGESFSTAITAQLGENIINGPAGDYWFAYTAEMNAVYSFATSGTLKHVNFTAGVEQMVADNVYRVDKGEVIYVCVSTTTNEGNVLTISGVEIVDGDYCDRPIYFELGEDITIAGRGVDNFHSFTAKENGIAVFQSTNWTVHFRGECGGRRLNAVESVTDAGDDIKYTYELPIEAGKSYIVEVTAVSEDITIKTSFKTASVGEIYSTAIEIDNLNDTIDIAYEFEKITWYKLTADKDGFYIVKAKLGYASNMTTKVGDGSEVNAGSDNSVSNAYMGGYKEAKVYVKAGKTLYIYTKTGRENDEKQFSAEFYLVTTFVEARPGEDVAVAIKAEDNTEYVVMAKGDGAYNQWYEYTIPAGKKATASILCTVLNYSGLTLYNADLTTMSSYKEDFVQTSVKNGNVLVGKTYEIAVVDVNRTIYIYTPIATSAAPVIWKIECDGVVGDDTTDDDAADDDNIGDDDTDDDTTNDDNIGDDDNAVDVMETTGKTPVVYDLMGRRVVNPTKGIYIINGVKTVIK